MEIDTEGGWYWPGGACLGHLTACTRLQLDDPCHLVQGDELPPNLRELEVRSAGNTLAAMLNFCVLSSTTTKCA